MVVPPDLRDALAQYYLNKNDLENYHKQLESNRNISELESLRRDSNRKVDALRKKEALPSINESKSADSVKKRKRKLSGRIARNTTGKVSPPKKRPSKDKDPK